MNAGKWAGILFVVGCAAIVAGAIDPMEGSVVILAGSAVVLGSTVMGRRPRAVVVYWLWTFVFIGVGVGAMFAWSSVGGFGGQSGRSLWWGLTILPYPLGWIMAMRAIVLEIIARWKMRHLAA